MKAHNAWNDAPDEDARARPASRAGALARQQFAVSYSSCGTIRQLEAVTAQVAGGSPLADS
jgi:hypothetical protein